MILGYLEIAFFLFSIVLAFNYYKRFSARESKLLFVQTTLVSFWLLMDILVLFGIQPQFMHHFKFVSIVSIPVLFMYTIVSYTDNDRVFKIFNKKVFWIIPTITMLMIMTNPYLGLMWIDYQIVNFGSYLVVVTKNGIMFWVHTMYSYLLLFTSLALLMNRFINSPPIYRRRSGFLLSGSIVAWSLNAFFVMENSTRYPLDPTPVSFLFIMAVFYWGLFQYGAQRIVPLARDLIVENMADMVLALDNANRIIDMNPSLKRALDKLDIKTNFMGSDASEFFNAIPDFSEQVVNYTGKRNVILGQGQNASYYEVERTTVLDKAQNEIGSLIVLHDITEMQKIMKKLEYLSCYDQLTGLYNRALFEIELERLDTPRQLPICIIVGDVNGLKMTNDAFGHAIGDELLQRVSEIIKNTMRTEDIIARTGGDEFSIILPQTKEQDAVMIIDRIQKKCEESGEKPIRLSVSWGHATKCCEDQDIHLILKEADTNMYKKKLLESKSTHGEIVSSLIQTLKESSFETNEHADRMKALSYKLGVKLKLPESQMDDLLLLALLHDLGKVGISDQILEKQGKLTEEEWKEMKRHTEIGYHIASSSNDLSPIADAILSHHERWDGNGYPRMIKGEDIPYISRIISVVDSFDVMTHDRVYRKRISEEDALEELVRCSGSQFDPNIVQVFCSLMKEENK